MNVELAYIKSAETEKIIKIVEERLNGNLKNISLSNRIEVPDSYGLILANDVKRKIAISSSKTGWITIIESKEVNDYALLLQLSKELRTEVVAIIQSDIAGAWGFVEMSEGNMRSSYFSEEDDDIEDLIKRKLSEKTIFEPLYMFREVVREKGNGWNIVQVRNKTNV